MPQESESRKLDQYIVRFPDGMRDRLKAAAKANQRSLNAEIVSRLQDTLEVPDMMKQAETLLTALETDNAEMSESLQLIEAMKAERRATLDQTKEMLAKVRAMMQEVTAMQKREDD